MIRSFAAALVLASSFASFAPTVAVAARTADPVLARVQTVKFTLRNDTSSDLMLSAGSQQMVLRAGKSLGVKLPEGEKIVAATDCGRYAQGDVVSVVAGMMNGNTLAIH